VQPGLLRLRKDFGGERCTAAKYKHFGAAQFPMEPGHRDTDRGFYFVFFPEFIDRRGGNRACYKDCDILTPEIKFVSEMAPSSG